MFEYNLVTGLTAFGADAYLLHVTTTPSVAYIARVDDFDCGIMISASHNPYYDNGIKLIDCYGDTGRILVHESGTELVVRVMVEAPDHDTCQKYVDEVVNVICEKGYKAA